MRLCQPASRGGVVGSGGDYFSKPEANASLNEGKWGGGAASFVGTKDQELCSTLG